MFKFKKTNTQCKFSAVKTIIFCGQKNILLGGHRDNGRINIADETEPVQNDGNFSEKIQDQCWRRSSTETFGDYSF